MKKPRTLTEQGKYIKGSKMLETQIDQETRQTDVKASLYIHL